MILKEYCMKSTDETRKLKINMYLAVYESRLNFSKATSMVSLISSFRITKP